MLLADAKTWLFDIHNGTWERVVGTINPPSRGGSVYGVSSRAQGIAPGATRLGEELFLVATGTEGGHAVSNEVSGC